mmetsp:Transcript_5349/g.10479  ORF Transcript_5349/g.10479 Transcript_5349/m.10479 type:complete len:783 (-) Transcript_5349:272-2620(-)
MLAAPLIHRRHDGLGPRRTLVFAAGALFVAALTFSYSLGSSTELSLTPTTNAGTTGVTRVLKSPRNLRSLRVGSTADLAKQIEGYKKYCESVDKTVRRPTSTVEIGPVKVGSEHPLAVQTMTTTNTFDVRASVDQVMQVADAGCDIVRLTVQGKKEANACQKIKDELLQRGYDIPLVADIHFAPAVAMQVADSFDKIRINPGNFYDGRKKFDDDLMYDEESYNAELEAIEEVFTPLVQKCKKLNRAMRIGTNHGSLSARTLCFYGDTPKGMVESAMEFARICRKNDFHNFVFSMKASNPLVMVQAYRLLAAEMYDKGWDYPLHLGVTEAGEGEDGRMKSAIGIGALLRDGLGDTIRVSLTEDPHLEIEPCKTLAGIAEAQYKRDEDTKTPKWKEEFRDWQSYARRETELPEQKEGDKVDFRGLLHRDGSVLNVISAEQLKQPEQLYDALGAKLILGLPFKDIATTDSILLTEVPAESDEVARQTLTRLIDANMGVLVRKEQLEKTPLENSVMVAELSELTGAENALSGGAGRLAVELSGTESEEELTKLKTMTPKPVMLLHNPPADVSRVHNARRVFDFLQKEKMTFPVIHYFQTNGEKNREKLVLQVGSDCGALLVDGYGDGAIIGPNWKDAAEKDASTFEELNYLRTTSFGMLQGCRMRSTKTEFVSCPSCGRTLFDLQETTAAIAERTGHLPGVAIAIMGCIVNGPGEMADADFGYVGGAPGKVDLYVGREMVKKGIPNAEACDALIDLIKEHGRWVEPEEAEKVEEAETVAAEASASA